MLTSKGHLTYCTNIHSGEDWSSHFAALKLHFPKIKQEVSPSAPMGIGLRLSNTASVELGPVQLAEFKEWLHEAGAYVFTMNGFPYGEFHDTVVKDKVHQPDWTTPERLNYTNRLADILAELLPDGLDGGISTSPLTYRHWFSTEEEKDAAMRSATQQVLRAIQHLDEIFRRTGKLIHLDIEPEPDGLLETGTEFIRWYKDDLLPMGMDLFEEKTIKKHLRLCYDVCHFALGYEDHAGVLNELKAEGIAIGKIQISAALKASLPVGTDERATLGRAFSAYNEATYLHQVIALNRDGSLNRYRDLPEALEAISETDSKEWRAHFHVPIFQEDFGLLQSTQADIIEVLGLHSALDLCNHLEVETYTWGVLPAELKLDIADSISRELRWVLPLLNHHF